MVIQATLINEGREPRILPTFIDGNSSSSFPASFPDELTFHMCKDSSFSKCLYESGFEKDSETVTRKSSILKAGWTNRFVYVQSR